MRPAWDSSHMTDALHFGGRSPLRHFDTKEKRVSGGIPILRTSCLFLRVVHFYVRAMPDWRYAEDGESTCTWKGQTGQKSLTRELQTAAVMGAKRLPCGLSW